MTHLKVFEILSTCLFYPRFSNEIKTAFLLLSHFFRTKNILRTKRRNIGKMLTLFFIIFVLSMLMT